MITLDQVESAGTNHPLAFRMAIIAFLTQNIAIACVWGSYSVLLGAVETRLGVSRELSTLGVPVVSLATALCAPIAGALAAKYSLRLIMVAGASLSVAGFAMLALTSSFPLYLVAFGLLIGPGMAAGVVLPASLVTRWYVVHRGRALGIVSAPIVIALIPLASTWTLQSMGVAAAYWMLAGVSAVSVIANLFIVDRPPGANSPPAGADAVARPDPAPAGAMTALQLLRAPRFWALMISAAASFAGSMILTSHMVPMARTWGYSATLAATLLSLQSFVGIGGTIAFGWLADRIGGAGTLALLLFNGAICWALLLLDLPFGVTAVIIGLIGFHAAGALPVLGMALSEAFGRESFSRAFGLVNLLNLPFAVISVPAAGFVYTHSGSYTGAIIGQMLFLLLVAPVALAARRTRR